MNKSTNFPVATPVPHRDMPTAIGVKLSVPTLSGLIANAATVSPSEFFAAASERFFPAPAPTRLSEKCDASRKFIAAAWASDDVPTLRAAYQRELAEIDARWEPILGLQTVTHLGLKGIGA